MNRVGKFAVLST